MATKVLDSWALITFFEEEPAAEAGEKILEQANAEKHKLLISVVNWGEVYYNTLREVSEAAAEQKLKEIATMPIEIVGADGARQNEKCRVRDRWTRNSRKSKSTG